MWNVLGLHEGSSNSVQRACKKLNLKFIEPNPDAISGRSYLPSDYGSCSKGI